MASAWWLWQFYLYFVIVNKGAYGASLVDLINPALCNQQYGCLFNPPGCKPGIDCATSATYRPVGDDEVEIILSSVWEGDVFENPRYVAIGFSADREMGRDAVTVCVSSSEAQQAVYLAFNAGKSNRRVRDLELQSYMVSVLEVQQDSISARRSLFWCRFRQKIRSLESMLEIVDLSEPHYLLLATGNTKGQNYDTTMHTLREGTAYFPIISQSMVTLTDVTGQPGRNKPVINTPPPDQMSQTQMGAKPTNDATSDQEESPNAEANDGTSGAARTLDYTSYGCILLSLAHSVLSRVYY